MMMDSDSDEEAQIQDLAKLTAILKAEELAESESVSGRESLSTLSTFISQHTAEFDKIQSALVLNKLYDEKLRRLERILVSRLKQCRERLADISCAQTANYCTGKQSAFRYLSCGKPYFKDKDGFPAPENDDVATMTKSGMYDLTTISSVPGWTVKDKSQFLKQIVKMSREIKKNEINSKISQLKRERKVKLTKEINKKIASFTKEIDVINKMPMSEQLVLPIDQEYDWDQLAANLNRRHSPQEYRALWKVFLHPSINKKSWDKTEHTKLEKLVNAHKLQDWDRIAQELGTGRTGYQCFVYFRTNMGNTFTGQKWTREEEEYLRRLIDYYREDDYIPWGKVAAAMENRTKIQLYNKYLRLLELRKGRFLPEEDAVILTCVENFGHHFKKIAKYLPGRSAAQLRTRFSVLKNTTRTSAVWTVEEDKKLVQLMANQDSSFINYAALTEFFPDKDRIQLRARYVTLVKWMRRHPNRDLSKAPRRGARRLSHGQRSQDLDKAVENLRNRIKSEVERKKSRKICRNSPEDAIEHAIIATLINENVKEERDFKMQLSEKEQEKQLGNITQSDIVTNLNETNLRKVLILLKAKLNKKMFENSKYFKSYSRLALATKEPSILSTKSYSRKDMPQTAMSHITSDSLNIWGAKVLTNTEYVMPPNYGTITGCRKLMALVSAKAAPDSRTISMTHQIKRNIIFKEQLELFMDRFSVLFTWPMLLSNHYPRKNMISAINYVNRHKNDNNEKLPTKTLCKVAIPSTSNAVITNDEVDLNSAQEDEDESLIIKPNVGNEDFMYIDGMDALSDLEDDHNVDALTIFTKSFAVRQSKN